MSNEADTIVSAIIAKWCAGFATLDAAALSSLYSKNAFFFGSNPKLYRGRDGVADYFNGLPRWRQPSAVFSEVKAAHAGPDLINMGATITFDLAGERPESRRQDELGHPPLRTATGRSSITTPRRRRR